VLWTPLKKMGASINRTSLWWKLALVACLFLPLLLTVENDSVNSSYLAVPLALAMVLASLSAFSQKHGFIAVWNSVALSSLLAGSAVLFLHPNEWQDIVLFTTGIIPSWLLGIVILSKLPKKENFKDSPFAYRAMAETHSGRAQLLFLSFLGLVGFPITPAFIGEDLLLYHASNHEYSWIAALIAICFVINGIAAARVFLRICMGRPSEICEL
jgi:NADH:ubiquinone oxidoreductase subunit 2 (subunit N)